jgi:hypothetical protein
MNAQSPAKKSVPRPRAELAARAREGSIDDLDYSEVTGLMDVVADEAREIAAKGSMKIRELAARIDAAGRRTAR